MYDAMRWHMRRPDMDVSETMVNELMGNRQTDSLSAVYCVRLKLSTYRSVSWVLIDMGGC